MKLAMTLKFLPTSGVDMDLVWEAERLGYEAVWSGEAYGTDAVTPVAWVLAQTEKIKAGTSIMQMPAPRLCRDDLAGHIGQSISLRHRPVRPAGGRGLARRAVRKTAVTHSGVRRDHPPDPRAQSAARISR